MSTFRIGDFLTIEGPLRVDLQSRTVTGFHHASFTQAGTALQFDASVEAHKAPLNVPTASTLTIATTHLGALKRLASETRAVASKPVMH